MRVYKKGDCYKPIKSFILKFIKVIFIIFLRLKNFFQQFSENLYLMLYHTLELTLLSV